MSQERKSRIGKEKSVTNAQKKELKADALNISEVTVSKEDLGLGGKTRSLKPQTSKAALKGDPAERCGQAQQAEGLQIGNWQTNHRNSTETSATEGS